MTRWFDLARNAPTHNFDDDPTHRLIRKRETSLKGTQSRFHNRVALAQWAVHSSMLIMNFGDKRLHANWSWTEVDVARQRGLEPTRTLYAEAAKVQANFLRANPGYRLEISPVRSLERQVLLWADNSTVRAASLGLMRAMDKELQGPEYPDASGGQAVLKFASKLKMSAVDPEPTSASPGSSGHGRGTAVDFVVMQGQTKVAGTDSSTVGTLWDARGWSAKVKAAVQGTQLKGPLRTPYEPWHWSL